MYANIWIMRNDSKELIFENWQWMLSLYNVCVVYYTNKNPLRHF